MLAAGTPSWPAGRCRRLPVPPSTTAWITYVRCHDDIGWAIDDGDAAAVGISGYEHRRFLSDWYAGAFPGSWARGLVFGENAATGDRRISGTAASLAGLGVVGPAGRRPGAARARGGVRASAAAGAVVRRRARAAQRPATGPRSPGTPRTTAGRTGPG